MSEANPIRHARIDVPKELLLEHEEAAKT